MSIENKEPEKLNLESMDIAEENRARLKEMFPTVFTETVDKEGNPVESIDFEKLKAELGTFSDIYEGRRERYGMDWPGKKDCLKLIQQPSVATLKPCREDSVDFDDTKNLFIEGDNLEVLKLLQKSYYGKVKMIYIDPPYNTGKEFIYPDKYSESLETYLAYAGLVDDEGKKFATNTAAEGRFHTKWLNMMFPRLYLARNLLGDNGVVFVSIDDHELINLKHLCNEVFGEENFVALLAVQLNPRGRHLSDFVAQTHEYIMVYARNAENKYAMTGFEKEGRMVDEYDQDDERGKFREIGLRNRNQSFNPRTRPKLYYPLYIDPKNGSVSLVQDEKHGQEVLPVTFDESGIVETCWTWSKKKVIENSKLLIARKIDDGSWRVFRKDYLIDESGNISRTLPKSLWIDKEINNDQGKRSIKTLFGKSIMDFPKSTELLKRLLVIGNTDEGIIIDFFSGSCATAQAVLDLNKEDNGNRKFIMVQLPEPSYENSEAYKAGYKTIADIGKERIRRVIAKIKEEQEAKEQNGEIGLFEGQEEKPELDLGFKVFKLDRSNFKIWDSPNPDATEEEIQKQLEFHLDHIDPKASQEDLLFEILLKSGFKPTEKVETKEIAGKTVFSIAEDALLICLEDEITRELINAVAEAEPMRFICLDKGFKGNDQLKANAVQTFAARNQGRDKAEQIVFRTV